MAPRVLSFVLAGGEGRRLAPLTADRAKPAVPFGGVYRLVDLVLSNLVNGGYRRVNVLTQYKSHSLDRHLATTWQLSTLTGEYVTGVPAQMRLGRRWYAGSADALLQSLNLVRDDRPDVVVVFGADHVYRLDPRQVVEHHLASGAGATVVGIRQPRADASRLGVLRADDDGRITDFLEKPDVADAPVLDDAPDQVLASMGNYVFDADVLVDALRRDAADADSEHDMGGDLVPRLVAEGRASVFDFADAAVPGQSSRDSGYWRDVGTLDEYYAAHMDLVSVHPVFNLYNERWPILTRTPALPPAKFVFDVDGRRGHALNSLVSNGVVVSGAVARRSVLSPGVRLNSGADLDGCVLLDGVDVGRGAVLRRCILDKEVTVPAGLTLGVDAAEDRRRFGGDGPWAVTDDGVVVVGKGVDLGA